MTDLELLVFTLSVGVVVGLGLLVALLAAVTAAVRTLLASHVGTGVHLDLADVETHLRALEHERYVTAGVVTDVVPESRRSGRMPFALARSRRPGVRVDVAIPTPEGATASEWFPLPDDLTGRSPLERLLHDAAVPGERLSDLVGREVPVTKRGAEWRLSCSDSLTTRSLARGLDVLFSRRV
ncbi:hypothetical protein [Halomarina litorea]|uniref:hypothetical protein n=1 Tax=Halomarina litorea TaxID=2961595 RepID=UPI0020C3B598|nr:hypothetical protein [Halomarina sp. BCD28]